MQNTIQFSYLLSVPMDFPPCVQTKHVQYIISEYWEQNCDLRQLKEDFEDLASDVSNERTHIQYFDTRIDNDIIVEGYRQRSDMLVITFYYECELFVDRFALNMSALKALALYISEQVKIHYESIFRFSYQYIFKE